MAEEGLPPSISQFIEQYVRSVEQLEIILLLCRSPQQEFRVQDVYQVIMSTRDSVQRWLDEMVAVNLAVCNSGGPEPLYKFTGENPALLESAQLLNASYKAYPVRVIEAIYRPRKPLTDPAQDFADAFRIRKD